MTFLQTKFLGLILLQFALGRNELLQKLQQFATEDGVRNSIISASIVHTSSRNSVLNFHEEVSVNSASTLKLITTATALSKLGHNYTYETRLAFTGNLENGNLNGDLLILPSGDPSLGSDRGKYSFKQVLEIFANAVKDAGIRHISGKILILDESIFKPDIPDSWIWGDLGNYYGAAPGKFMIHENLYTVYFNAGEKVGEEATLEQLIPFNNSWTILNEVKTGASGSGDQVYIYSSPLSEKIRMTGTVPLGSRNFPVKGSIPNPAAIFSFYLKNELQNLGVSFEKPDSEWAPEDLVIDNKGIHLLSQIESLPLSELMKECNFHSINLYADAFLKSTSGLPLRESGNFMKEYWKLRGLTLSGFQPKDGSGLSPSGYITTRNMTDILQAMTSESEFPYFLESIPVVGKEGSVKFKDPGNKTGGRLRAKSGSIEGTRSYAGYFKDKKGEQYAFMICINRYDPEAAGKVRRFLDDFLIDMAKN